MWSIVTVEGLEGEFQLIQPNTRKPERHIIQVGEMFEMVFAAPMKVTLQRITEKGNYFFYSEARKALNNDVARTAEPVHTFNPDHHYILLCVTMKEALDQQIITQDLHDRLVAEGFEAFCFNLNEWTYVVRKTE